jgi:crossover junction endodeoxyribonuclease RusA
MHHGRKILKPEVAEYKSTIALMVASAKQTYGEPPTPFQMFVYVYPPDRRKRDLDNILKIMQDGVATGLCVDDSIINAIAVIRCDIVQHGLVEVIFTECNADVWIEQHGRCQHDRLEKFGLLLPNR